MTQLIQDLSKRYNVNMVAFLTHYAAGESRESIAKKLSISVPTVRLIATLLHLRLKKKYREIDYANLQRKLLNEDKSPEIEALEKDLDKAISDLVKAEKVVKKLTLDNRALKRKIEAYQKLEVKEERLETILEENAAVLAKLIPEPTIVNFENIRLSPPVSFEGLCVVLSDLHIGAVVNPEEVGNTNQFNYNIARTRLSVLTHSVIGFPKQSNHLTVFIIGDILDGIIHGAIHNTEDSFVESVIKCAHMLYDMLKVWSKVYKSISVFACTGNHGRVSEQPAFDKKYADYEYLVIKTLEHLLKANETNNVEISFSKSGYILEKLNGANILAYHGDGQRTLNITNPKSLSELQAFCLATFGESFRHTVSGHWHKPLTVYNQFSGVSIQTGSLIGTNAFSFHSGFAPTKASQPIFFVEENGDIDLVQHLTLQ